MTKEKIEETFKRLSDEGDKAFIAYIMAGDGGLENLESQIKTLEESGVDLIEIGIPFSDPAADGPVIQEAGIRALENGVSLLDILNTLAKIKDEISVPYVLMTYYNPVYKLTLDVFRNKAEEAGVSGIIVPDVPLDEEAELKNGLRGSDIAIIRLATLTTSDERLREITRDAEGFIYAVTVNGVTGGQNNYKEEVYDNLERIKRVSPIPVCAGFGVSNKTQAEQLGAYTDGVIVGSKIVKIFYQGREREIKDLIPDKKLTRVK
ncbi:tryptophan synthase subunit alpha [Jeotgalicoccus meleagridis]|uniref:Tryptophan synthase alpha chain n=1 Tax=Jeotgalicoccus meleagridis TaxID=2759181 RepID=A0A6V7RND8_9STAP|nr:tryptophan synthase subunit alpha [Jeotgalicoccus meleagridis]CAD2079976.1 Tryptophan synthase alpha chain [Jeotgalicoccus meleagridis]